MKKKLLLVAGFVSLALGLLGVVLPLMPTAPFIILAAACFSRSSARFHTWLVNHPLLGVYVRGYLEGQGIPRRAKLLSLIPLWGFMGLSAIFFVDTLWIRLLMLAIALLVTLHIMRVPEPTSGPAQSSEQQPA